MGKLVSKLKVDDKVYMTSIYAYPNTNVSYQPRVTELYVKEIKPMSGFDSGYSVFVLKETMYRPNMDTTRYMRALVYERDDLDMIGDEGRECDENGEYTHDTSNYLHSFFTSRQDAINHIVFHYESGILDWLRTLKDFKKSYGNSNYDFLQMKTKEFEDDNKHYVKYELTSGSEPYSRKIEQELAESKYLIYKRDVELDCYGQVRNWGNPWLFERMDPYLICDSLEEASAWVAQNDQSKDKYLTKTTQYRIMEVKKINTLKIKK